jgi:hypothetical protein
MFTKSQESERNTSCVIAGLPGGQNEAGCL